ncbi:MAG TPA: ABC transporter substrate-binding protein [Candidatus Methylomirabilis sp.]|nr:ABC transporter substrate-binding protein [Candidatus Methylomirabilis sp.]HSB82567.1 ABC transporter substrate-binding protein [Candidatus Methylomirabilis sp.]
MCIRRKWISGVTVGVFVLASFTLALAQAKPIKIGQIIPMTGEAAESGRYHKQGAEIAIDKINAAGGIKGSKLTVVLEDDQTTNPGAVAALQKLLEDKEIPMILGSIRSTQVQAMLPTINEAKIPVAIGGTNYGLTHSGSQWVFRFRPNDGMSAKVIAKFMVDELKLRKVGIVHASDAFGNGGRDMLTPALKALGAEVVFTQGYNNQEKDFTAVVQGLKKSGATGLNSYMTFSTDLGIFARQLKQLGAQVKWVGSPSITAVDGRNLAGDALYGTYGVTDFHVEASPTSAEFAKAYKAKFGQEPDLYAAWCYDAVLVFAEAMKRSPDLKPENLRKAILGIQKFPGAEGEYNFDGNGDGLDHYHVVQNVNGSIKYFKTLRVPR